MTRNQINTLLENYRQMIAIQTSTTYVPTVLTDAVSGLTTRQTGGKFDLTTIDGKSTQPGIVL
jgi:hypothetical protein